MTTSKLTSKDIDNIVAYIRENISVYAGKGDNKRCLVKPGLKISHKQTGLDYTVQSVTQGPKGLVVTCSREPDVTITILGSDLKEFERA